MSLLAALLASLLVTGGCGDPESPGDQDPCPFGQLIRSASRDTSPEVTEGELAEQTAENTAFALDLYLKLGRERSGQNLFFSPLSVSMALAMTHAGARGQTAREMATVLGFTLHSDRLHPAFNALGIELKGRERVSLELANALWLQTGEELAPDFVELISSNYGAGLRLLDFAGDTAGAVDAINDWCSCMTKGRIEELVEARQLTPDTRLVLTNAVYFLGTWKHQFDARLTAEQTFTRLDGGRESTKMMHMDQAGDLRCVTDIDYVAVELPYMGDELVMTIVMPAPGRFDAVEASLGAGGLEEILADMQDCRTRLAMPSFTYLRDYELRNTLIEMGMPAPFSVSADFSGMGLEGVVLGEILHEAFILVDEVGTEAAAATAVPVQPTSAPGEIILERPFVFLIRDRGTRAVLFIGRFLHPPRE